MASDPNRARIIGTIPVEEAYIYQRITLGLSRGEMIQTVTGLLDRRGPARPSTMTLRDGTAIHGAPFEIESRGSMGPQSVLEIKVLNDADGSTHIIPIDEVTNLQ